MDGVFSLGEGSRADFVRSLMHSFGCSYICLWHSHSHPHPSSSSINNGGGRLLFLDGAYNVTHNHHQSASSSSSSSLGSNSAAAAAQSLFNLYQRLIFDVNNNDDECRCVPGIAFKNHMPYLDLQQSDLLALASPGIQTQFYQEARIERAIFMGCKKGEIELGFSAMHQIDIEGALRTLFPEDFCRLSQQQLPIHHHHQQQQQNDINNNNNRLVVVAPSSSNNNNSSCLRTLSTTSTPTPTPGGSLSPLIIFPATTTTSNVHHHIIPPPTSSSSSLVPNNVAPTIIPPMQTATTLASPQFIPTPEAEQEAIIKAFLHVISSPPSTNSHHQNLSNYHNNPEASSSAFKMYYDSRPRHLGSSSNINSSSSSRSRQSLVKRSIAFSRKLHLMMMRMRERSQFQFQAVRQSATSQLHHTISERTRRDKLNQRFQALRPLLPPSTKNVKAAILIAAKETLKSLMAELEKLKMRNQQLTTLLMSSSSSLSKDERLNVRVLQVPGPSSSEERMVELQVIVRSERNEADIVIRLLEFLKRVHNVRLISMDANTHITIQQTTPIHQFNFRLRLLQGSEWDESAFEEAVRRVVADYYLPNTLN